jgi:hypothetical protein
MFNKSPEIGSLTRGTVEYRMKWQKRRRMQNTEKKGRITGETVKTA